MTELTLFDPSAPVVLVMTEVEAREHVRQIKLGLQNVRNLLLELYERDGWLALGYKTWRDCTTQEFQYRQSHVYELLSAAKVERNISAIAENTIPEGQLRPIAQANLQPQEQREVWQKAIESAPNGKVTARHVEHTVDEYKRQTQQHTRDIPAPSGPQRLPVRKHTKPEFYSVTQWEALSEYEKVDALHQKGTAKFNETNDNVEWALWTWNPITGCLHTCPYCYARDIANRFYSHLREGERFSPVLYPARITAPANTKVPDFSRIASPITRMGKKNVFTCSMADLFGKWVPHAWIEAVLQQAWQNPQWNFLFLTKFPIRMAEFDYPPNAWIGTTVDSQYAVDRAEKAFAKVRAGGYQGIAWLSCEPMLERLSFSSLDMFDWVVIGGASSSTQTPAFKPPWEWTNHLYNQAKRYDLPVYMKTNMGIDHEVRVREIPARNDVRGSCHESKSFRLRDIITHPSPPAANHRLPPPHPFALSRHVLKELNGLPRLSRRDLGLDLLRAGSALTAD